MRPRSRGERGDNDCYQSTDNATSRFPQPAKHSGPLYGCPDMRHAGGMPGQSHFDPLNLYYGRLTSTSSALSVECLGGHPDRGKAAGNLGAGPLLIQMAVPRDGRC